MSSSSSSSTRSNGNGNGTSQSNEARSSTSSSTSTSASGSKSKSSKKRPLQATASSSSACVSVSANVSDNDGNVQAQADSEPKYVCGICHKPLHFGCDGVSDSYNNDNDNNNSSNNKHNQKLVPMVNHSDEANNGTNINGRGSKTPIGLSIGSIAMMGDMDDDDDDGDFNHHGTNNIVSCSNEGRSCCRASTRTGDSPHFHFSCLNIPKGSMLYNDLREYMKYEEERKRYERQKAEKEQKAKMMKATPGKIKNGSGSGNGNGSEDASDEKTFDEKKEVENPFLCPLCDVQGTSKYLYEYFINFRSTKEAFYGNDGEAKDYLQPVGFVPKQKSSSKSGVGTSAADEYKGTAFENGFVKHLITQQLSMAEEVTKSSPWRSTKVKQKPTELTVGHIKDIIKSLPRAGDGNAEPFDLDKINATILLGQPIRLFCSVTNSYHSGRIIDSRIIKEKDLKRLVKTNKQRILMGGSGSSSLGGKSGSSPRNRSRSSRIGRNTRRRSSTSTSPSASMSESGSKSKNNEPSNKMNKNDSDVLLDKDIGRTQYLIRFRAELEGRKIPVQQWLFLEEHPMMVGVTIVWAKLLDEPHDPYNSLKIAPSGSNLSATVASPQTKKAKCPPSPGRMRHPKKARSKFRPAQIFLRTALEMMHVNGVNMNPIGPSSSDIAGQTIMTTTTSSSTTTSTANAMSTLNGSKSKPLEVIGFLFGPKHRCLRLQLSSMGQSDTDLIKTLPRIREGSAAEEDKTKKGDAKKVITLSPRSIQEGKSTSENDEMKKTDMGTSIEKDKVKAKANDTNLMPKTPKRKRDEASGIEDEAKTAKTNLIETPSRIREGKSAVNENDTKTPERGISASAIDSDDKTKTPDRGKSATGMHTTSDDKTTTTTKLTTAKKKEDTSAATAASLLESSLRDLFVADFHNPPEKLMKYLKLIKTYDDQLVYATAFACMEEEETRRVVEGHIIRPNENSDSNDTDPSKSGEPAAM